MRIDIEDTAGRQPEISQPTTSEPATLAAVDEASAAAVARRTGAIDAGAAPAGPRGGSSASLAIPGPGVAAAGTDESAGSAPLEGS